LFRGSFQGAPSSAPTPCEALMYLLPVLVDPAFGQRIIQRTERKRSTWNSLPDWREEGQKTNIENDIDAN